MAIDWSHLPKDVISKVCLNSTKDCSRSFVLDRETGYWVCTGCRKPSVQVAVKECDVCEVVFVPKYYEKILYDWAGILCDTCEPPVRKTTSTN
jgi:hypothetical protein